MDIAGAGEPGRPEVRAREPRPGDLGAGADVAFAFALLRCGTPEQFERTPDQRLRLTIGLRRLDGRWTVTHEHHSFADASEPES